MATTINAAASTGIAISGDGSGIMKVQSNGVTTNALAWVNFNGTATSGSATIRSSYNVSSITVASAGSFTLNFATNTTDINYVVVGTASADPATYMPSGMALFSNYAGAVTAPTTSAFTFCFGRFNYGSTIAPTYISLAVFGN